MQKLNLSPQFLIENFNKIGYNKDDEICENETATSTPLSSYENQKTSQSLNFIDSPQNISKRNSLMAKSLDLKFDLSNLNSKGHKILEENIKKQDKIIDEKLLHLFEGLQLENRQSIVEQVSKDMKVINILLKNEEYDFSDFQIVSELGKGAQGKVYKVKHKITNQLFAMKEIILVDDINVRNKILMEIKTLFACKSPYIVKYYGAFYTEGKLHLLLELMDKGTLESILKQAGGKVGEIVLKYTTYQILKGLKYLHKDLHIIHRDIKPGNILVNSNGEIKISDLGICGSINHTLDERSTFVGTSLYMSPERLTGESYTVKTDIWSLGLLINEFSEGVNAFSCKQNLCFFEILNSVMNFSFPEFKNIKSKEYIEFLNLCTKSNPKERADVLQLLELPFVKSMKGKTNKLQPIFVQWLKLITE